MEDVRAEQAPAAAPPCDQAAGARVFYVPVVAKFAISLAIATTWFAVSTWISMPWIDGLSTVIGQVGAWAVVLAIALIPGWLNAFLVSSLLMDRPPALCLDRQDFPPVTLLIAAYNEEDYIGQTLTSIARQDYPADIEVIVIDDGSGDSTPQIVRAAAAEMDGVRLLQPGHGGKAAALNCGLAEASNEYIISIDADTWLHPEAIKRLMARFLSDPPGTAAVAGGVLTRNSRTNFMTRMQEWDYFLAIASVKRQQALYQGTLVAQGAFSAYRKSLVEAAGGWPSVIGEDIVLTWALIKQGHRIGFEGTAIGFTNVPDKLRSFARQRKRWARGMIEGLKTHGDTIYQRPAMVSFLMGIDLLFPILDLAYTMLFLPGIVLALFGYYYIAGPLTLFILPLTVLITVVMLVMQRRVFDVLGLKVRRNWLGYFGYLLIYQAIMSPVCVAGYAEEIFGTRKRW